MPSSAVSKKIENFASDIYIKDSTGENFIENIINTTNLPALLSRLKVVNGDKAILEMGFGEGTITEPLLAAGYEVEIVEGSAKLCDNARERFGSKLKVNCSYFENFTPSRQFNNVLSLHVLEHVDQPADVVRKIHDWVAPGGQVIAVVPNAQSLHRELSVMMGLQEKNDSLSPRDVLVGHQRVFTLDQLAAHFEAAGFEITERFGYFVKVVPNSMMVGWNPDLIKALTSISVQLPPHLLANVGLVATKRAK
ncbi:MAG: class I SAM-dependent methyltransferase [Rhizobacter sp.]|nr:class I SAM-dependent methyltransferase [Rhizobacter sp.]